MKTTNEIIDTILCIVSERLSTIEQKLGHSIPECQTMGPHLRELHHTIHETRAYAVATGHIDEGEHQPLPRPIHEKVTQLCDEALAGIISLPCREKLIQIKGLVNGYGSRVGVESHTRGTGIVTREARLECKCGSAMALPRAASDASAFDITAAHGWRFSTDLGWACPSCVKNKMPGAGGASDAARRPVGTHEREGAVFPAPPAFIHDAGCIAAKDMPRGAWVCTCKKAEPTITTRIPPAIIESMLTQCVTEDQATTIKVAAAQLRAISNMMMVPQEYRLASREQSDKLVKLHEELENENKNRAAMAPSIMKLLVQP